MKLNNFCSGFIAGIILKEKAGDLLLRGYSRALLWYHTLKRKNGPLKPKSLINDIYVLCKIKDLKLFSELFPNGEIQPQWDYYKGKNTIKIKVTNKLDDDIITCEDFLENTGLDIALFRQFSELFVFVHYTVHEKEYINVYSVDDHIDIFDFKIKPIKFNYTNLICVSINVHGKYEYITKYFKMFLNNELPVQVDLLLSYYDKLQTLSNVHLHIVNTDTTITPSLYEYI
jgi:hypothetical protein